MAGPLRRLGQQEISGGKSRSESEADGTWLCRYLLSPQTRSEYTARRDCLRTRWYCPERKSIVCRNLQLQQGADDRDCEAFQGDEDTIYHQPETVQYVRPWDGRGWIKRLRSRKRYRYHHILSIGTGLTYKPLFKWYSGGQPYPYRWQIPAGDSHQWGDDCKGSCTECDCRKPWSDFGRDGTCMDSAR